ncbi:MAG: LysR family transcriptional regulator [Lachnospiraceae bacterium]|nr:LysR family transcriptional regulator [Lachnospiraceae bacterium]
MKSRNYEYVNAIYQEGSFSKAAQKLFISQPALSAAIKKLESELYGISLFNRGVNPITLTPAGEYYLTCAEKIAELENQLDQHFASLAGIRSGTLNLGSSSYFCTYVLPDLIHQYMQKNPDCTINLVETDVSDMEEKLKSGALDLIIDVEVLDQQIFESLALETEYVLLAVPADSPVNQKLLPYRLTSTQIRERSFLSDAIPAIDLSLIAEEPFLLLRRKHDMHKRAMDICRNAGFEPKVRLYLDQLLTAYNIAKSGKGVTFVRNTLLDYVEETDKLCYYKLSDEMASRKIWISCKKYPEPSPLADDFIKYMLISKMQ